MFKSRYFALILISSTFLVGCSINQVKESDNRVASSTSQLLSKNVSVELPVGYTAYDKDEMLIVLGPKGKIIIGGFRPSVGQPDPEEKDFPYQGISYSGDPKADPNSIPASLYYRQGDESTMNELSSILKSAKKINSSQ